MLCSVPGKPFPRRFVFRRVVCCDQRKVRLSKSEEKKRKEIFFFYVCVCGEREDDEAGKKNAVSENSFKKILRPVRDRKKRFLLYFLFEKTQNRSCVFREQETRFIISSNL
jgi:hypothetical protein